MRGGLGSPSYRSRRETLPKAARVRSRRDFLAIQGSGRRHATRHFLLVHRVKLGGPAALGITVTRKIGEAVVRNRIKRAVREVFRRERACLDDGLQVVVIVRQGAGDMRGTEIAAELAPAIRLVGSHSTPGEVPSAERPR